LAVGFIETNDLGSTAPFFLATGLGVTGAAGFASGFCGPLAAGFFKGTVFFDAGLAAIFLEPGLAFSFFLGTAPPARTCFLAASLEAGFLAAFFGAGLAAGFLEAAFPALCGVGFLLAIRLAFF
jgi:hypothetical protein